MECGGEESTGTRTKKIRPWLSSTPVRCVPPPGGGGRAPSSAVLDDLTRLFAIILKKCPGRMYTRLF